MIGRARSAQCGMALVVGLILLALMTIMAITSFSIGRTSMDIIGNMQRRAEVIAAANNAIQVAISTTRVFENPDNIFLNPCAGANTQCYDFNGDGTDDVTVTMTPNPRCTQVLQIPNAALNYSDAENASCAAGTAQLFGIEGAATGNSLCSNTLWEIKAEAVDEISEARIVVTQGTAVRFAADEADTLCD